MKFKDVLTLLGQEPVFETGLLLAGAVAQADVQRQLSRWVQAKRIYQLRRGLYTIAPPYQKVAPHPFLVANRLVQGSYVSCQTALAYYGLIPEYVAINISVTTQRPGRWTTPVGHYEFRHIKLPLFTGYQRLEVIQGQWVYLARPEKALLDLAYLFPGADDPAYLQELRLQNLYQIDTDRLWEFATKANSPKLLRVAEQVVKMVQQEEADYEIL
jgi:predicted transcriptional regulator of viral defense system